jgi:transcriptional regulator with XRE-family HTH domain
VVEDRRSAFCARLKAVRESRGITLEHISASTKIGRPLLKGLEENDLSRWPQGIYRRAYIRDYLRAIDLQEETIVVDFLRLFTDEEPLRVGPAPASDAEEPRALSLTLADDRPERLAKLRTQLAAAGIDLAGVLTLSGVGWSIGADLGPSTAVAAIGYYSIGTAVLGRSFGSRCLEDRSWRRPTKPASTPMPADAPDTLLARMREAKGLSGQSEPAITGGLFGMLIVGVIRTLLR